MPGPDRRISGLPGFQSRWGVSRRLTPCTRPQVFPPLKRLNQTRATRPISAYLFYDFRPRTGWDTIIGRKGLDNPFLAYNRTGRPTLGRWVMDWSELYRQKITTAERAVE